MLHICQKRFVDRTNENIIIKVYSNESSVSLLVNDESYGEMNKDDIIFTKKIKLTKEVNNILVYIKNLTC